MTSLYLHKLIFWNEVWGTSTILYILMIRFQVFEDLESYTNRDVQSLFSNTLILAIVIKFSMASDVDNRKTDRVN